MMEIKMNSSPEFKKFARRFIQDLELVCKTDDEALNFVLEDLDMSERKQLAGFINQINSRQVSDFEIKKFGIALKQILLLLMPKISETC